MLFCLQSICIHPQHHRAHTHTLIQALMLLWLVLQSYQGFSSVLTSNPVAFWRNSSLQELGAAAGWQTGSQSMGTWTSSRPRIAHALHIYSIDFLSSNSFQLEPLWSTFMAKRWWKGPFTATLSSQFSGLSDRDPGRGQLKAITDSTKERFHIRWNLAVMICACAD